MIQDAYELLPQSPYRNRPDLIDPFSANPYVLVPGLGSMGFDISSAFASSGGNPYAAAANVGTSLITSLFHVKTEAQKRFDAERTALMQEYQAVLNVANAPSGIDAALANGDYDRMLGWINQVQSIMARHTQLKNETIAAGEDPAWVTPRYEEWQRQYQSTVDAWVPILQTIPHSTGILDSISHMFFGDPAIPAPVAPRGEFSYTPLNVDRASMVPSGTGSLALVAVGVAALLLLRRRSR